MKGVCKILGDSYVVAAPLEIKTGSVLHTLIVFGLNRATNGVDANASRRQDIHI